MSDTIHSAEAEQTELRARLCGLIAAPALRQGKVSDAIVAHIEINEMHGVGVLLNRLFGGLPGILSIRSQDQFGGQQQFGERHLRLQHGSSSRPLVYRRILEALPQLDLKRVLAVPYFPDDVRTAIALADLHGCPLFTWLMDDQNLVDRRIPDALMRELLERSRVRFAISGHMRDAYEAKYDLEIGVLPPTISPHLIQSLPLQLAPSQLNPSRGAIVGNVWGAHWLTLLRKALRGSDLRLDWFCNSGSLWLTVPEKELAADGIVARGALPTEEDLKRELQGRPFAIVPSGTLDQHDDRRGIAALSLPSRLIFIAAAANTPALVLGSRETAAARFVESAGLGLVAGYQPAEIAAAVKRLVDPLIQRKMRAKAAELAPSFSSKGLADWIWRSLECGAPADRRFEDLFPRSGFGAAGDVDTRGWERQC